MAEQATKIAGMINGGTNGTSDDTSNGVTAQVQQAEVQQAQVQQAEVQQAQVQQAMVQPAQAQQAQILQAQTAQQPKEMPPLERMFTEAEVIQLLTKQHTLTTQLLDKLKPGQSKVSAAKRGQAPKPIPETLEIETAKQQAQSAFDVTKFETSYMGALGELGQDDHTLDVDEYNDLSRDLLPKIKSLFEPCLKPEKIKDPNLHLKFSIAINRLLQCCKMEAKDQFECLKFLLESLDPLSLVNHKGERVTKEDILEFRAEDNYTPLGRAFLSAAPAVIGLLIRHKANPFQESLEWRDKLFSPFLMLARRNPKDLKEIFEIKGLQELTQAQKPNVPIHHQATSTGLNLFMTACCFNNLPMIKELLKLDPKFHLQTCNAAAGDKGYDAFMCAAAFNRVDVLKFLHEKYPDFIKTKGYHALHEAARRSNSGDDSNIDAMEFLLDHGDKALVNQFCPQYGAPLHCAAMGGHVNAIRFLLSRGAKLGININVLSESDERVSAQKHNKKGALKYLEGAHQLLKLVETNSITEESKISNEGLKLLKSYPANLRSGDGNTLLHLAIMKATQSKENNEALILKLIEMGASPLEKNEEGDTCFECILRMRGNAIEGGRIAWERILDCYNAAVDYCNKTFKAIEKNAKIEALNAKIGDLVKQCDKWPDNFGKTQEKEMRFQIPVCFEFLFEIDTKYFLIFAERWGNAEEPKLAEYSSIKKYELVLQFYRENKDRLANLVLTKHLKCIERKGLHSSSLLKSGGQAPQALSFDCSLDGSSSGGSDDSLDGSVKGNNGTLDGKDGLKFELCTMLLTHAEGEGLDNHTESKMSGDLAESKSQGDMPHLKDKESILRLKYALQFFLEANNLPLASTCFLELVDYGGCLFYAQDNNDLFKALPEGGHFAKLLPMLALLMRDKFAGIPALSGGQPSMLRNSFAVTNSPSSPDSSVKQDKSSPGQSTPQTDAASPVVFSAAGTAAASAIAPVNGTSAGTVTTAVARTNGVSAGTTVSRQ